MIVVTMTDCPPALRGDLSKWLMEINTGVYVGQVSARVRDKLWERITTHIKNGRATMVFDAANEQKMDFRIHNTTWEMVDYDGLKLVRRPSEQRMRERDASSGLAGWEKGFSKAAKQRKLSRIMAKREEKKRQAMNSDSLNNYTIVDIETTGLNARSASIIEFAAVRIRDRMVSDTFNVLVKPSQPIPTAISELTGLTDDRLVEEGIPLAEAMHQFIDFIGEDVLLIHNASFDMAFIGQACRQCGLSPVNNRAMDTCMLARKALLSVPDYRLSTLASFFNIAQREQHRALADCYTAMEVYQRITQTE